MARHAAGGATPITGPRDADSIITTQAVSTAVQIPLDPEQGVSVQNTAGGPALTVDLRADALTQDATVADDTAVYAQPGGKDDVAVQALNDGSVRATVFINRSATHDYPFRMTLPEGVTLAPASDGGVDMIRTVTTAATSDSGTDPAGEAGAAPGTTTLLVGHLDAPWATDADGNAVPTSYTIDGDTVTQHVSFDASSAFPIVADPKIVWHWYGPVIVFNRTETGKARTPAILATMVMTVCWAAGPETLGIACGVDAAEAGAIAAVASNAYGDKKCLAIPDGVIPHEQTC